MSDDSMDGNLSSNTSSPEKRRSTVPDILPHQRSFEKRYSHMIHKQILETGVNKEALQRQINAYFSCGGAGSSGAGKRQGSTQEDVNENVTEAATEGEEQQQQESSSKRAGVESRKTLDKAETVDIAELQGAKVAGDL
ncbi:uncharacterized protein LOC105210277 [Zeugodacus cucurbitae]|uniref:Chromatin structure-remodeling complex subunit SFH1 n=1 Tax=Zeugodacus cucurbitae TaxID=28588 RepID=A0A0A1X0X3_ZEUCU|nr:uncharacterized protein LOC105210277 [Zeugodacus cucurbitae]